MDPYYDSMGNHPIQDGTYPDGSEYMEGLLDWADERAQLEHEVEHLRGVASALTTANLRLEASEARLRRAIEAHREVVNAGQSNGHIAEADQTLYAALTERT